MEDKTSLAHDMTEEGWQLVKDVSAPEEIALSQLEIISPPMEGTESLPHKALWSWLEKRGATLGQRHAEYLLGHPAEIPKQWRKHELIFPGTVWYRPSGRLAHPTPAFFLPCLIWEKKRWGLHFYKLGKERTRWLSRDRFVRLTHDSPR